MGNKGRTKTKLLTDVNPQQERISLQKGESMIRGNSRAKKHTMKIRIVNRKKEQSSKIQDLLNKIDYMEKKNETLLNISKQLKNKNEEAKITINGLKEKINALEKERNYLLTRDDQMLEKTDIPDEDSLEMGMIPQSTTVTAEKNKKRTCTRNCKDQEKK